MADVPEIEVLGVESVTLEDSGAVVAIKLEADRGFQIIRMPFQTAVDLLSAMDAAVLPNEAVAILGKKSTH